MELRGLKLALNGRINSSISLSDWFIDRRHCNLKWQESASSIREKINIAIQDMPPNEEITHLLSGTCTYNIF